MKENDTKLKDVVELVSEKEYELIYIKEDCLFKDIKEIEKLDIPINIYILEGNNFINKIAKKQKIYNFQYKEIKYIITISNNQINISQSKIEDDFIYETIIEIVEGKGYNISSNIHKLNYDTKESKKYSTYNNCEIKELTINKKEAIKSAQLLLDELRKVDFIYKIINVYAIYNKLNLIPDTWYNAIISDEVITLSSNRYSSIDTVNDKKVCSFNIILNNTKEKVGEITFNLKKDSFTYDGNVGYEIKEEYRNKGYASRALRLLKEVVKTNNYVGDKDLFIATVPDNIYSQKVAENNEGVLIYDGEVPKKDIFNYKYGVNKVKVYQIRMNREQINS